MTTSRARALAGLALLVLVGVLAGAAGGCASVIYRVPGTEVQRLAQLPPMSRGDQVRVVPHDAPLSPSTQQILPAPPIAPAIPAPPNLPAPSGPPGADDEIVIEDEVEPPPPGPGLYVDVSVPVGGRRPFLPPPVAPAFPRAAPVSPGTWRGAPVASAARPAPAAPSAGVWRGTPVGAAPRPAAVPVSGGWRGTPVSSAPRAAPRPVAFGRSSGGHHGGGGGNSAAVVGGVVAVVGLVAILAVAAEHASEVEAARTFDGWVSTPPTHILHLRYGGNLERTVPLYNLRIEDTVGVRYAFLRGGGGSVTPIGRAVPVSHAAAPAAPPTAGDRH